MQITAIDYLTILGFAGIFLLLFAIAEIGYHWLKIDVNYTRKFVHVMTGIIVMFFPFYFTSPINLVIICISFFIALALSKRLHLMQSINAIDRKSRGSTLYPVVVIICYFIQYYLERYIYFFLPIMILALADPAAEFVGRQTNYRPYEIFNHKKTVAGSIGFFTVALITSLVGLYFITELKVWVLVCCSIVVALVTTISEAISIKGYDNLVIPLTVVLVLYLFGI
ncbi:diacylglycerol/polyprenol kinase family protein [Portibacter marinus]|uniref:diacylglycerol/polyprenol kinase family protein n=1 Tax=Portibacter marinus TaxID=2898660 RepID=UPI001F1B48C3|nr:hypothetical protein [Portibacter marinus]